MGATSHPRVHYQNFPLIQKLFLSESKKWGETVTCSLHSESKVSQVYWVQFIWMHKWSHLIVNICAKYFFFFFLPSGGEAYSPFPPAFPTCCTSSERPIPALREVFCMTEQAVLQILDPEFWEDSPPGNVSGFWCWEETQSLCVPENEVSPGERTGHWRWETWRVLPTPLRKGAQLELYMNWAGSTGGRTEQELTLFHAKRCTEVVLNRRLCASLRPT